jgi:hypothetical protein
MYVSMVLDNGARQQGGSSNRKAAGSANGFIVSTEATGDARP